MSSVSCIFFSHSLANSPWFWVSGLHLEDITGFRCCPLHLLKWGQNRSHHKLQREDGDATVGAGKAASKQSSLFSQHTFFYYKRSKNYRNKRKSMWQTGSESKVFVVIAQNLKHTDLDPETGIFSRQTWKGQSSVKWTRTDQGGKGWLHTQQTHTKQASAFSPILRCYTVHIHTNREHDHHSFIHTWNTRYLLSKSCTCERMKIDCNTANFSFKCTCKRPLGESPLCVVWCNIVGDSLLSVIYHSAVCI